jgi:hypothetical protein
MRYLAIFLTLCSVSALADSFVPQYSLGVGVAEYNYAAKRHLDDTAMLNGILAYRFSDKMGIEFLFGNADSFDIYAGDLVYYVGTSDATLRPYVLGGLGVTSQQEDEAGNTTLLGLNGGAGIQYVFSHNISFFSDLRDIYSPSGGKNDWMWNTGITFSFDCPVSSSSEDDLVTHDEGSYELQV